MIAGLLVNDAGLMIFLLFLICFTTADFLVHLSERHLRAFYIAMIILSLVLTGYACYCKWHQANARLEQTREVQP
jgi:predicted cation transporter